MSEVKLCKDCRFHDGPDYNPWCYHPESMGDADVVTGFRMPTQCTTMRSGPVCDHHAKLWEPKPRRWWQFWRPSRVGAA